MPSTLMQDLFCWFCCLLQASGPTNVWFIPKPLASHLSAKVMGLQVASLHTAWGVQRLKGKHSGYQG